jgi:hypothetical protein
VAVELADHPVQRAQRGVGGQPGPEHRDPLVALAGQRPVAADLVAVEAAGEAVHGGRLAQPGQRVDHRRAAHPVRILPPGRDDQLQLVMHGGQLRGPQDPEVGVPVVAGLVVVLAGLAERCELSCGQRLWPLAGRRAGVAAPAFLAGQAIEHRAHSRISNAPA